MNEDRYTIRPCDKHPEHETEWMKFYNYYCFDREKDFTWGRDWRGFSEKCPKCLQEYKETPNGARLDRALKKLNQ